MVRMRAPIDRYAANVPVCLWSYGKTDLSFPLFLFHFLLWVVHPDQCRQKNQLMHV